jgi:poly-gamma-glutamate capsule biosynthesis protein CapA/YwtB (metallophosphatase superfamily)
MPFDPKDFLHRLPSTMDRRTILARGVAIAGGLFAGLSLRPSRVYGQAKTQILNRPDDNTWNVIVCGEAMVCRPFSMRKDPEFLSVVKLMRESDVTYAHSEMNYGDLNELQWASRNDWAGSFMISDPQVAKDLKWMGVDIMSLAQNHSHDWGPQGILSTIKTMEEAGIAHAGTGRDLEEARSPAFVEKDKGRVALISISSGNIATDRAGLAKGSIPGRPGMNPIRVHMRYEVDHETAEAMKAAGKKWGTLNISKNAPNEFNITPLRSFDESEFAFIDGNKFEIQNYGFQSDIEGNLRSIDEAKQMADLVMVAHHTNLWEDVRGDLPCKFFRAFAKQAIDAGADMFIGHGWHQTLGIEIYKNKPLIFGCGNFFAQNEYVHPVPADSYESHSQFDMDKLVTFNHSMYPLHPEPAPVGGEIWWQSAVYQLKFEGRKLTEIRLHPVEMGWDVSGEKPVLTRPIGVGPHVNTDGIPRLASGKNAEKILERIQRLSAGYGTKIEIKDGIGICKV